MVVGLKEPQAPEPQAVLQVTAGLIDVSFVTMAVKGDVAPTCRDAGAGEYRPTTMGRGDTMVTVAEAVLLGSATELAMMVTAPPLGMAAGAVYVMPPAFALAPNVPQAALAHLTAQLTVVLPVVPVAYVAAACRVTEAFTAMDAGGANTKSTAVGPGGGPDEPPPPQLASRAQRSVDAMPKALRARSILKAMSQPSLVEIPAARLLEFVGRGVSTPGKNTYDAGTNGLGRLTGASDANATSL